MDLIFHLGAHGKHLWTRETAREVRAALASLLDGLAVGDTLVVDLKDVEVFDFSFANELFGKLALTMPTEYPERFVIVENLTSYTRENLAKALESLGLAMISRKEQWLDLIGKVHPIDEQTFRAIERAEGPITAAELKEVLQVNLNAMNERLNKLAGMGLVRRDKSTSAAGREQYQYRLLA